MDDVIKRNYEIKRRDFFQAGKASIDIKNLLKSLKLPPDIIRRAAVCGYEAEMNIVMHAAGDGTMFLDIDKNKVSIIIQDTGPGIADIEQAMQAGFSTASDELREMGFGAGMGLPNIKKNADVFRIASQKESGTTIKVAFETGGENE